MSNRILVATRKGLFLVARQSHGWRIADTAFLADNVTLAVADRRDGAWYAALEHGHFGVKMHRSPDQGGSWEECACPEYPAKPEGEEDVNPALGQPVPWKLVKVWALAPGGADQPGLLWCGTIPGGLFYSRDGARSWTLARSLWDHPKRQEWFGGGADLPGIHSVCVDPRDSKTVRVGVSCGGVWRTGDGGASWENCAHGMWAEYMPPQRRDDPNIQDPHRIVQCATEPDCLWAQHHNGIFRTRDGARSWHEVTDVPPSHFGFAVAVHPHDPDTAWFVPAIDDQRRIPVDAKVVVTRTRDGGKTFQILRDGLPQANAYDLTLRHALDVDGTGRRLCFGTTTGSLWISEDQGDTWETVSQHLPPVYAVHFVPD